MVGDGWGWWRMVASAEGVLGDGRECWVMAGSGEKGWVMAGNGEERWLLVEGAGEW